MWLYKDDGKNAKALGSNEHHQKKKASVRPPRKSLWHAKDHQEEEEYHGLKIKKQQPRRKSS